MGNDLGRWRRAFPRLFRHPAFTALDPLGQRLTTYLLLGPQSNRIGLFHFSITTAAEDLGTTPKSLKAALVNVTASFGWISDGTARVFYIPTWWRWNHPDHAAILIGNMKDLNEIAPCGVVDAFAQNLSHLDPKLHETFVEACRRRLPPAPRGQDQDQKQKQKQKAAGTTSTTDADCRYDRATKAPKSQDSPTEQRMAQLVDIARQTLHLMSPQASMDELVDAFGCQSHGHSREEAVAALNVALNERRQ